MTLTLISIIAAISLVLFVFMEVFVDNKEIGHMKDLQRRLIVIAKKQCEKSIGVIVELDGSAESMVEFIGYLRGFDYDKLKIVIVADKATDKASRMRVAEYISGNRLDNIRIMNRSKNTTIKSMLRRYLSSQLIIVLNDSDRLSKDFFEAVSVEALKTDGIGVILPNHQIKLNNTLASLFQAHFFILRQLKARLFGVKTVLAPLRSGVVYSRDAILGDAFNEKPVRLNVCTQIYIYKKIVVNKTLDYLNYKIDKAMNSMKNLVGIVTFVAILGAVTASTIFLKPYDLLTAVLFVVFIYILTGIFIQVRIKGYSLIDNINLVFIAPIGLMFEAMVYILGFVKLLFSPFSPKYETDLPD